MTRRPGVNYRPDGTPIPPWEGVARGFGSKVGQAVVLTIGFQVLIWAFFVAELLPGSHLENHGIHPRNSGALSGIVLSPLLHASVSHIMSNASVALVVVFLLGLSGLREFFTVTAWIVALGGALTWLFAVSGNHIGASGLIYGWLAYLIVRGVFTRSVLQIIIGVVLAVSYFSLVFGFVPQAHISWQGHLFGAVAGVSAAAISGPSRRRLSPVVGG